MSTQIETISALERRLSMAVPIDSIDKQVGERLKRVAQTFRMPGFRPGKVPMKIVAQQYEGQMRGEVIGELIQKAFTDAVESHQVRVAGYPKIEPKADASSGQLEFNATFEVYPDVTLADISATAVERGVLVVGDADVDRTIDSLRKQRATFAIVERVSAAGDRVIVDFVGKVDGEAFEGGSGTEFPVVLGDKRMLPEFEAALAGKRAGEQVSFPLTFPADYPGKDVAGKTAQFEVTVTKIEAPQLPPIDAELAKSLGVVDGDLTKMRAEIRDNVEREVKQRLTARNKDRVMQALLDSNKVDVPKSLVEIEQDRMVAAARQDLAARGLKDADKVPIDKTLFVDQATRRVSLGLIVGEYIKQHQLTAKPEHVRKLVEEQARTYEQPFEVVKWVYTQPERLAEFEGLAVEENVVNWVFAKARVTDQAVGFDDLMGSAQ